MLAWTFPQVLVAPSSHANRSRNFPRRRRPCWRGPSRKVLLHRQATPTRTGISRAGAARVGVGLPARPCSTDKPRQQGPNSPETAPPVLAWASPQGLVLPSSHANKARNFPCRRYSCWRQPLCKVLIHRQATPTRPGISRAGVALVGVGLPARPCFIVEPRQQGPEFPVPAPSVLAWVSLERLDSPSSHANKDWNFLSRRRPCWRGPSRKALFHRRSAPTGARFSRGRSCCRRINPSAFSGNSRTLWCLPSR